MGYNKRTERMLGSCVAFLISATGFCQSPQTAVDELRTENRLPEWANYLCYQDDKSIISGWLMLVAYQPDGHDFFFERDAKGAKELGYKRGFTFQEYTRGEKEIRPINMPSSSEMLNSEVKAGLESGHISMGAFELLNSRLLAANNAVAIAKEVWDKVKKSGTRDILQKENPMEEEDYALLDGPDRTNFHNYVKKHPEFSEIQLQRQKYYDAGMGVPPDGTTFKSYNEGNVIFERDFGSEVFETLDGLGNFPKARVVSTRIQMQETSSGLRFLMSHAYR